MPRPIIMTEDMKNQARKDFNAMLSDMKMSDGKFNYSKSFQYKTGKATVQITQKAYRKMLALVTEFSDEVGWHGTVSRSDDAVYIIEDIFVYPQEVTGSTVNTDQESYTKWLYNLDEDTFGKLRMQGHSHVNMGVSPSGVDDRHRQQILDQLDDSMFYIFMIWNKKLDMHTLIYDMERNILYEDKDIEVKILDDEEMEGFLADANTKVQKKVLGGKKSKGKQVQTGFGRYPYSEEQYNFGGDVWGV